MEAGNKAMMLWGPPVAGRNSMVSCEGAVRNGSPSHGGSHGALTSLLETGLDGPSPAQSGFTPFVFAAGLYACEAIQQAADSTSKNSNPEFSYLPNHAR